MSSLLGDSNERLPLARALEALADSARRASHPGFIWLVGVFYPSLYLTLPLAQGALGLIERATEIEIPYARGSGELVVPLVQHFPASSESAVVVLGILLVSPVVLIAGYRLIVGLAKVSDPGRHAGHAGHAGEPGALSEAPLARPSLLEVWRAGRGIGGTALGMWLVLVGMLLGALIVLVGPLVMLVRLLGLREFNPVVAGLVLPFLVVLLTYAVVLQVLNQLALHSLAHNRRGIASALTHAWRLVRASPWSATRATVVDFALFVAIELANALFAAMLGSALPSPVLWVVEFGLVGFAGVTRAGFWARAYRALGGLSAADHVPGLSVAAPR